MRSVVKVEWVTNCLCLRERRPAGLQSVLLRASSPGAGYHRHRWALRYFARVLS